MSSLDVPESPLQTQTRSGLVAFPFDPATLDKSTRSFHQVDGDSAATKPNVLPCSVVPAYDEMRPPSEEPMINVCSRPESVLRSASTFGLSSASSIVRYF